MRFWRIAFVVLLLGLPLSMTGCEDESADTGASQEQEAPEKPAEEKPAEEKPAEG